MNYQVLAGYVLLIVAGLSATSAGNFVKKLTEHYLIPPLMFWLALSEGILSLLLNVIISGALGSPLYHFEYGRFCLLFVCLYFLTSAIAHCLSYVAYSYLYISTIAVASVYIAIVLYISQRTYLSAFHPGHTNVTEVFGIIIVTFGAACMPVLLTLIEKKFCQKPTVDSSVFKSDVR